jgi:hypothetical protein
MSKEEYFRESYAIKGCATTARSMVTTVAVELECPLTTKTPSN